MVIEKIKLTKLKPAPYNPRKSNEKQEAQLKASLEKFGVVEPIIFNKQTGYIVGGHFRVRELQKLGYKEVECVVVDLNEEDEKELNIRLNANTGEWDIEDLQTNWDAEQLRGWGLELPGFEIKEAEAVEDDYEMPDEIKTDIVLGDLFEIGEHRLLCGDSTDSDQVAKLMNGEKADMVFTDPPYGVSYTGGLKNGENGLEQNARQMIKNDDIDLYEDAVTIADMFCSGPVFMFYADTVPFGLYRGVENVKGQIIALLIWKKEGGYGALGASYKQNHEPCLLWKTKGANLNFIGDTTENRIWEIKKDGKNKLHPTQKPIEIPARAIGNHKADKVLDLFLGSGSTMVASHQLKRKCYGMELDPKYCQVIIDRMLKLDPTLIIKRNGEPYKTGE